jgi:hypothetical protein
VQERILAIRDIEAHNLDWPESSSGRRGCEDDEARAKHTAARRWVSAINNWGELNRWAFHVCHDPQRLGRELAFLLAQEAMS